MAKRLLFEVILRLPVRRSVPTKPRRHGSGLVTVLALAVALLAAAIVAILAGPGTVRAVLELMV
jgi:hypothetical protein